MQQKRRVTVVTTSRADFGIFQPVLTSLTASKMLAVDLLVSGNHVVAEAEQSTREAAALALTRSAGVALAGIVPMPLGDGTEQAVAQAMGAVTSGAAAVFAQGTPDLLLVLGDRYEMHAVVAAASAFRIPVAHIHGGEESEGAIDSLYRHSMSKLSHLHFCATELSKQRLLAMGEEPWRVHVSGAPALDGLASLAIDQRPAILEQYVGKGEPFFLATFHPETLDIKGSLETLSALIAALDRYGTPTLFSRANADQGGTLINEKLDEFARSKPWLRVHDTLGRLGHFGAMKHASIMVGNSSSGIIEAATFKLPVVNVGQRQAGRERSANVIDSGPNAGAINRAIDEALSPEFRRMCASAINVYGTGTASHSIRLVLETVPLGRELLIKRFHLQR